MVEKESAEPGPTSEEISAVSASIKFIIENPETYKGENGVVTSSESSDGQHSRKQFERTTANGSLIARQQLDWDESLLEPTMVETLYGLARLGEGFAEATITISRGKLMHAAYTDRQDRTKSVDGTGGDALEAAALAFSTLAESMKPD